MLPDTSKARMTVPSLRGRHTAAWGRASATARTVSPLTSRIAGIRARSADAAARTVRLTEAEPAADDVPAGAVRRATRYSRTPTGTSATATSMVGQMNDTVRPAAGAGAVAIRTIARTRSSSVERRDGLHARPAGTRR